MYEVRMSKKELGQISVFEATVNGKMTRAEGADVLGLSERQLYRKLKIYREYGPASLAHQNRGRPSNNAFDADLKSKIIELCTKKYPGYGPTLAAEKLLIEDDIKIDHETLRRLLIKEGIRKPNERPLELHVWRERKHNFGQMGQLDASKHRWFGDDTYAHLLAWIDDATGKIELLFRQEETTEGYAELTKSYLKKYGRVRSAYTDRGKTFKVNTGKNKQLSKTQYQRMLSDLGISIIHARSPQAKGRVERLFKTLQDRLVKELIFKKINDIETANRFLQKEFIDAFNNRFSVAPKNDVDLHQSIEGFDLNAIFCQQFQRTISNDYTITFGSRWFQLAKKQPITLYRQAKIIVGEHFDGTIELMAQGHRLNFKEIPKNSIKPVPKQKKEIARTFKPRKPSRNHPWRSYKRHNGPDISKESKT